MNYAQDDNARNLHEVLQAVLSLKKELKEAYLLLLHDLNSVKTPEVFFRKSESFKKLTEKISGFATGISASEAENNESKIQDLKARIKSEIHEISKINEAFSGLVKKNIYYNQLTISFIAEAFNKNSIYNKAGANDSGFLPLKNVLIGSGITA